MSQQPQQPDNRNFIERKFNLPHLNPGELKETLNMVNQLTQSLDTPKIKQVSNLANLILRIQQQSKPGEMDTILPLLKVIFEMSAEKITAIDKTVLDILSTVQAIQSLIKILPPDMLKGLDLKELAGEIKKETRK